MTFKNGVKLQKVQLAMLDQDVQDKFSGYDVSLAQKANVTDVQNISKGSPKGVYTTLSALQTAFPTGDSNIYLVTADGNWYYWNGSAWIVGGVYQSTGIATGSVTPDKTNFLNVGTNLFNSATAVANSYINASTGAVSTPNASYASDYISVSSSTLYTLSSNTGQMAFYNSSKTFISGLSSVNSFTTPSTAVYVRLTVDNSALTTFMMVQGSVLPSNYVPYGFTLNNLVGGINTNIYNDIKQRVSADSAFLPNGSVTPQTTNFLTVGTNLFNSATVTTNNYINYTNGNMLANTGTYASDYIPVTASTLYTLSSNTGQMAFYNSSKTYISGLSGVSSFTTPSNTAYVRLTVDNSVLSSYMMVQGNTLPSIFIPYGFNLNSTIIGISTNTYNDIKQKIVSDSSFSLPNGAVKPQTASFLTQNANLFDQSAATTNNYINYTNGNMLSNTGTYASDYIPVTASTAYILSSSTGQMAFYTLSKTYISGLAAVSSFTTPSNAAYARLTVDSSVLSSFMIVQGNTLPSSYVPYGFTLTNQINVPSTSVNQIKPFSGKTANALGDSITAMGKYISPVKLGTGFNSYTAYGVPGATVAINNTYQTGQSFIERVTSIADADLWTVFGGTNDWFYNTPMGDITSTDQTTFYGALKAVCENILTRPNKPKLVLFTPLQSNRNGSNTATPSHTMLDFVAAIKNVAQYYSIPVVDLYTIGGFNPLNIGNSTTPNYTSDGVHPTDAGTAVYAPKIVQVINNIV